MIREKVVQVLFLIRNMLKAIRNLLTRIAEFDPCRPKKLSICTDMEKIRLFQ